jgi:DNA polymerase
VKDGGTTPGRFARYLRQQGEIGGDPLFLGDLTRDEALALAAEARRLAAEGAERADAGGRSPSATLSEVPSHPSLSPDYQELREAALACRGCGLAETRTNVVFSDGNPLARLMVVGEAPGAQEDKTGLAFVGPAGKYLDLLLASIDLSREVTAYICNVLKCRPPGNRNPLPVEIEACTPYLKRQIELIAPEAILAVGTFSAQFLTGKNQPLGRLRGEVYSYQGVPLVVTYHPAALLRNPGWVQSTWDDLQLLRQVMDGV